MSDDASKLKKVKIETSVDFNASDVKIDGVELYYSQSGKTELRDTAGLTIFNLSLIHISEPTRPY